MVRAVALLLAIAPAGAVVIGVDFGARFLKVAAIKPGSGIEMVFDEASKRKSSAAVAFNNEDERVLGDDAYNLAPRLPKRTYVYIKTLLGKAPGSPAVAAMSRLGYPYAFELNKTSSSLAIRQDPSTAYLVEELAAFVLSYAKKISEAHVGAVVRDCVLTVPPFWQASERLALMRGAEIAGLNVLSLLHETTAVAFKYGFDKEALFAEKPLNVVFYDLGAAAFKVSVVEFSSAVSKRNKTTGSLTVKGVGWDEELGGVNFDACVADYLVDSFVKAHPKQGKTLRGSERGMAKIRKEAERIKETLSANTEIPVAIEALHEEVDFRMVMKRAEFEQRCDKLWGRFRAPIEAALAQAGLTAQQVDRVEIVGGATRIPRVKQIALDFFQRQQLDMSLNGDEACALGAALYAAKMSTSFRLREFGISDLYPHEVKVKVGGGGQFDAIGADDAADGEGAQAAAKEKVLFKRGSKFPHKKLLTLSREADFSIDASLNGKPMSTLDVSGVGTGLAAVKTARREPAGKPKASVTFALNTDGLLEIAKAEVMIDVVEEYDEWVTVNETAAAAPDGAVPAADADGAGAGAGAGEGEGEGEAKDGEGGAQGKESDEVASADGAQPNDAAEGASTAEGAADAKAEGGDEGKAEGKAEAKKGKKGKEGKKPPVKKEKVTKSAKRVHLVPLKTAVTFTTTPPPISAAAVSDAIARNTQMLAEEERRRVDSEAKNRLEAYLLSTRDRIGDGDGDGDVTQVSTDEQRAELGRELDAAEEWLYDEGRSLDHTAYSARLAALRALGEPIFARLAELEARPAAVASARERIAAALATVGTWAEEKPQISSEETARTLELAANATTWLDAVVAEQEAKAAHDEPAFTSAQVEKKVAQVEKAVRVLGKKPKPKPAKAEQAGADAPGAANATDENATSAGGEAEAADSAAGGGAADGAAAEAADAQAATSGAKNAAEKKDEL